MQTEKVGVWSKNDFYNYLKILPKNHSTLKRKVIQFYVDVFLHLFFLIKFQIFWNIATFIEKMKIIQMVISGHWMKIE